ncbi:MAG: trypsin-like peptidase domain-containing protein [Planctomycetia bacterium]|nr:trypsin-like peptidase domain-containing protein [Planctomycetia bacterium]
MCVVTLLWLLASLGANDAAEVIESLPLSTCAWVRAENDGAGGGFVVDVEKRLLITCRHIVADRKKVDVFFPWYRDGKLVTARRDYLGNRLALREAGLLVVGTVLKTSDEHDLALVELETLPPGTKAVSFSTRPTQLGESLRVVGHRLDLDTVWNVTLGPVRATGKLADGYFWRGKKLAVNANVLIGQLPTEEGDSGGPVFDSRGEVVGMASALRRACPLAAVVISADEIRRFVNAPAPPAKKPEPIPIAETLLRATVWVKPTATDLHLAGVLIEKNLVLTCARGLPVSDRVGIALPLRDGEKWIGERSEYCDPLSLHLRGAWRSGTVLARDSSRDLALIRLDAGSEYMKPVALATVVPKAGDELHAMSHPGGLEFAWVYAAGSVRQRGKVALDVGERALTISALVCQLPAQTGSPGGPILNAKGELVGVLSARESAQQVGYAATTDEIRAFLDVALQDRPPRTLAGLFARIESLPQVYAAGLALALADRAEVHRKAGRLLEAKRDSDSAVSLNSGCVQARLCRARMMKPDEALAELDTAIEKGPFHRDALLLRAELAAGTKDWRKARGDLERILAVFPADAEARQRLAGVLLELGEDAKAASAIGDTLRADPKRLPSVAADLLTQADALARKFPDSPSLAADWLTKALTAADKGTADAKSKTALTELLKQSADAKTDAERLRVLLDGLKGLK